MQSFTPLQHRSEWLDSSMPCESLLVTLSAIVCISSTTKLYYIHGLRWSDTWMWLRKKHVCAMTSGSCMLWARSSPPSSPLLHCFRVLWRWLSSQSRGDYDDGNITVIPTLKVVLKIRAKTRRLHRLLLYLYVLYERVVHARDQSEQSRSLISLIVSSRYSWLTLNLIGRGSIGYSSILPHLLISSIEVSWERIPFKFLFLLAIFSQNSDTYHLVGSFLRETYTSYFFMDFSG